MDPNSPRRTGYFYIAQESHEYPLDSTLGPQRNSGGDQNLQEDYN